MLSRESKKPINHATFSQPTFFSSICYLIRVRFASDRLSSQTVIDKWSPRRTNELLSLDFQ